MALSAARAVHAIEDGGLGCRGGRAARGQRQDEKNERGTHDRVPMSYCLRTQLPSIFTYVPAGAPSISFLPAIFATSAAGAPFSRATFS